MSLGAAWKVHSFPDKLGFASATLPVRHLLERLSLKGPSDDQIFKEVNVCDFKRYLRDPWFIPCRFDFGVRVD